MGQIITKQFTSIILLTNVTTNIEIHCDHNIQIM